MTSSESSKEVETTDNKRDEVPSGSTVSEWFSKLKKRWEFASKEAKNGKNWKEKVMFFLAAFFMKVGQLSEEEKKIEEDAARKSGELLFQLPEQEIVGAIKKELVGDKKLEDAQEVKVVDDFSTILVHEAKNLGENEDAKKKNLGIIAKASDKLPEKSTESLTPLEKRILIAYSFSTLAALKKHPDYSSAEKFAAALDKFESATGNGKGLGYLKSSSRIKSLLDFTKEDAFSFKDLLQYLDVTDELIRKVTLAPLSYEHAFELQKGFTRILPNTSDENRAKALQVINKLIVDKNPSLINRRVSELVFFLDTRDFEFITKLLLT